jgi:hypothetical protein
MNASPVHSRAYSVLKMAKGSGIHTTRHHLTKKLCGSIGNTTLHSLPGLYILAISNAPSMLSASNATLNLAALLLTSMEIFITLFFFRCRPVKKQCMAGCEASASARWLSFCRPCSHFSG